MFVGKNDYLGPPEMGKWTRDQINSTVHYQEIDQWDHWSFTAGKNMSYFEDVLALMSKYNPF